MNKIGDVPAVVETARRFLEYDPSVALTVAAPAFDKGGVFETLFSDLPSDRLALTFAADGSPLERLIAATERLEENDYFIRVDGLHFAALTDTAFEMLDHARGRELDCLKLPDDFPVQLSSDIYRVGALRKLARSGVESSYTVHPKYALIAQNSEYKTEFYPAPAVDDTYLNNARNIAETVYYIPRMEVNSKGIEAGNQLTFHYQMALEHLPGSGKVLDIACGDGYGSRLMAESGYEVLGGDIDPDIVSKASASLKEGMSAAFKKLDVTALDLPDATFDAVVSMETIEHVDDIAYLTEIRRVLKPGGRLILSTPQNSLGHIPINAEHVREYSLAELEKLCSQHFNINHVIGIKQGRIILPDSPLGTNTVLVCTKE